MPNFWTQRTNMPVALRDAEAASIGNKFYVVGGYTGTGGTFVKTLYEWDADTLLWTQKSDMPGPIQTGSRLRHGVESIGTKLYVSGGVDNSHIGKNTLLEWDQATNVWTTKANIPTVIFNHGTASIGTKLYVIGGHNSSTVSNKLYEWDQATNVWTTKADTPSPWEGVTAASIGTKIYVKPWYDGVNVLFREFYEWDQTTNTWNAATLLPNTGFAGDEAQSGAIGQRFYLFGWINDSRNILYVWDQVTNVWTARTRFAPNTFEPLTATAGCTVGNSFFVAGGHTAGQLPVRNFLFEWQGDEGDVKFWTVGFIGMERTT